MFKKQGESLLELIEQKEKEIIELKDLFVNLQLKRIEREDKERETLKSGEEYDDPSNVIGRVIAYCRESPFSLGGFEKKKDRIKREELDPHIKQIMEEKPHRMKVYSVKMEYGGAVIECNIKTDINSARLANDNFVAFDHENVIAMVLSRKEEWAVELAYERWIRAIKDALLRYKNAHATVDYEAVFKDVYLENGRWFHKMNANEIWEKEVKTFDNKTEKIVKDAIQKVIIAAFDSFRQLGDDYYTADAIKAIEACLEEMKKKERE